MLHGASGSVSMNGNSAENWLNYAKPFSLGTPLGVVNRRAQIGNYCDRFGRWGRGALRPILNRTCDVVGYP
jgi:hypothetical protein